jgi:tetratricopeptide (TPR) repeat protein
MANVFGKTLIGIALSLALAGAPAAQVEAFEEGVALLRLGKPDEALAKFEEVLAADPSNEQAFDLYRQTDQRVWEMLLHNDGEIGKIAKLFLQRARVGRKERNRDEAVIGPLVETATSAADFGERSKAALALMADHGEFAVPALVEKIGNPDDEKGQVYGILALQQIGRPATLPLVEALKSDNETLRTNAAAALAYIKDMRAAPALARLAGNDAKDAVRYAAGKALAALGIGAGADPVKLHLDAARRALTTSGIADEEFSEVVWSMEDGKLVANDVPPALYSFELAKKSAHDALALDPVNEDAKTLLARAYLAEAAAIKDSAAHGDEALAPLVEKIPGLTMMASATGPQVLRRAVADSIGDGMVGGAIAAIELLADVEEPAALGDSPLVAALDHADKRISFAAALALANAAGQAPVPAAERVVRNLANAVSEESIRLIKVIDAAPATAGVVREATARRGMRGNVADSAVSAMDSLYRFPNVDVVVINEILPDERPEAVIGLIKKDPRLQHVKVLVLAKDVEKAAERFGSTIDGTIQSPLSTDNLQKAVDEALPEADETRKRADAVAVAASQALRRLGASAVSLDGALGSLAAQLNRDDSVAVPAAAALGASGGAAQVGALLGSLESDGASIDLKVAAAKALGAIYARTNQAPDEASFNKLIGMLKSGADAKLARAIADALGRARLAPGDKLKLVDAIKGLVRLGNGAASDEG